MRFSILLMSCIGLSGIVASASSSLVAQNRLESSGRLTASYHSGGRAHKFIIDTNLAAMKRVNIENLGHQGIAADSTRLYLRDHEAQSVTQMGYGLVPTQVLRNVELDGFPIWFDESEQAFGVLTPDVVVGINDGWDVEFLQQQEGVISASVSTFAPDVYLLKVSDPLMALEVAQNLLARPEVTFAHPDFLISKDYRQSGSDNWEDEVKAAQTEPFAEFQWHIRNQGKTPGGVSGEDINILPAWMRTLGHQTVNIAVIDDGFDLEHEDLLPAWRINSKEIPDNKIDDDKNGYVDDVFGWNFMTNKPNVITTGSHGTAVAGLAAARLNGRGVVGTCPKCSLIPVVSGFRPSEDAKAFYYARARGAHIITNSWGYRVGTATTDVVSKAISDVAVNSNQGRGTIILFAMNNINKNDCKANDLDISAIPEVFAVSGVDHRGVKVSSTAWGPCMEVLSTTRASSGNGITTTDQSGDKGYNTKFSSTDFSDRAYTRDFGGTSAATPIAAGVFGLILSVFPDLDRQSAYDIVTSTASKIRPTEAQYNSKGFSEKYGYGRIDAAAAVQRALEQAALSGKPIGPGAKTKP